MLDKPVISLTQGQKLPFHKNIQVKQRKSLQLQDGEQMLRGKRRNVNTPEVVEAEG